MNHCLVVALSLFAVLETAPACAQYYGGWGRGRGRGLGYGTVQRTARTRRESFAYGLADVTRARSQANLTNAQALSVLSGVRSKEIQNNVDYTNMFFERRRINEEYRETQRRPAASSEQMARFAADGMPDRSSGSQVDSVTGDISWPAMLQAPKFDEYRDTLDSLFRNRAETGSMMGRDAKFKARSTCDAFDKALRGEVRELSPSEFIEGRRFIDMLRYEATLAPT
jgi:hypothetical protein